MGMAVARLTSEPRTLPNMHGEIAPELEAILMRALARDPARRYASVAEMVGALRQLPAMPASSAQTHSSQFYALPAASTGKTVALAQQAPPPQPASGGSGTDSSSHSGSGGSGGGARWHPWMVGAVLALVLLFVVSTAYTMSRNAAPLPPVAVATATPTPLPPTVPPDIPTNPVVAHLTQQGWTHFENTRYNEAAQSFAEAERQSSGNPEPAYGQGRAHLAQGQYEQAIEDLTRTVRLGSEYGVRESAEVYAWLGEAYTQQGVARDVPGSRDAAAMAYEQAEQAYRRAVSLPTDTLYTMSATNVQAFAYTGLGWVLYYQGDYGEARTQFETSLSIIHDQATTHNGLAWTLYTQGDYQSAYSHFHRALAIDENYANAQYGLGLASEELNREREARDAFEKTLEIDPTYEEARERLEQLNPALFP
jgi:serine/threonine-protein kinase